jgi:hypothetical protein
MKTFAVAAAVALLASADAFTVPANSQTTGIALRTTALYGYVPDGFTAESYKKFKEQEAKKAAKQNLGKVGPRGFQSRSMQSFQEAMERGEATHLLPVFNAKERIKNGELKVEDIPVSHFVFRPVPYGTLKSCSALPSVFCDFHAAFVVPPPSSSAPH